MKSTNHAGFIMKKVLFGEKLTFSWLVAVAVACMAIMWASFVFTGSALAERASKHHTLVVHIATDDAAAANMAVMLASNMLEKKMAVVLFLDVKGVTIGVKNPPKNLEDVGTMVKTFLKGGGRVLVCQHCLGVAGFKEEDLLPSAELNNPERMSKLLHDDPIVLDY
jgi:predicted peroxiredoxin